MSICRSRSAALFDVVGEATAPRRLALEHVERRENHVLWLRYRVLAS